MKYLKIEGFNTKDFGEISKTFRNILRLSAREINQVSLKFCSDSIKAMGDVLGNFNNGRFSMYSWKRFDCIGDDILKSDIPIKEIHLLSDIDDIRVTPFCDFHEYFADGMPEQFIVASFGTYVLTIDPVTNKYADKNDTVENYFKNLFSKKFGDSILTKYRFASASGRINKKTYQSYRFSLPTNCFTQALEILQILLPKEKPIYGVFEHEGTPDELLFMINDKNYNIHNYPTDICCSFGSHGKAFSFAPEGGSYGWIYDIPNSSLENGLTLFEKAMHTKDIHFFQIGVSYCPWRMPDGSSASLTSGNQVHCMIDSGKVKIKIGIEQYSDQDIPVRKIRKNLETQLASYGLYLK